MIGPKLNPKLIWLALALSIAVISRWLPHPPNFTALGALALWGATFFNKKYLSLILPVIALLVSDFFLGFHTQMIWVYAGFLLVTLLGWWIPARQSIVNLIAGSFLGGLIFFIVSNFGVWMIGGMYAPTVEGLLNCYVMAIPFFWAQLAGNFFFNAVFALAYKAFRHRFVHFENLGAESSLVFKQ